MTYVSNSFQYCQSAQIQDGEICYIYFASFFLSTFCFGRIIYRHGSFSSGRTDLISLLSTPFMMSLDLFSFPALGSSGRMNYDIDCVDVRDYYYFPPNPQMKKRSKSDNACFSSSNCVKTLHLLFEIGDHITPEAPAKDKAGRQWYASTSIFEKSSPSLQIYFLKTDRPKILSRDWSTCQSNRTALKKLILVEYPFTTINSYSGRVFILIIVSDSYSNLMSQLSCSFIIKALWNYKRFVHS